MLQPQYYYNLIQAVVYFIAAIVPVYFILKLKNTNNDNGKRHLRNMTILLVSFILIQGVYHFAGTIGFNYDITILWNILSYWCTKRKEIA